jgi:Nif-specific regulatory protein
VPPQMAPPSDMPLSSYPPMEGHRGAAERERLMEAMERSGWVQAKAARILGITPRQIGYALKKHGIPIKRF